MSSVTIDSLLNTDLSGTENGFLGGRKITDLPVYVDERRIPPSDRPNLDRVIDVDHEVERFLADRKAARDRRPISLRKFFTWLLSS